MLDENTSAAHLIKRSDGDFLRGYGIEKRNRTGCYLRISRFPLVLKLHPDNGKILTGYYKHPQAGTKKRRGEKLLLFRTK